MAGAAEARRESFWAQPPKTGSSFTCSETLPGWDKCILSTLWCTLRWWNQWHSNHRGFQNFGMSAVPQCSTCLLEYQMMFGSEPQIYYDLLPGFWPIAISLVIHGGFQRRIDPNHSSHGWPAACLETSMVTTGDPFKDHMYQDAFMYIYISLVSLVSKYFIIHSYVEFQSMVTIYGIHCPGAADVRDVRDVRERGSPGRFVMVGWWLVNGVITGGKLRLYHGDSWWWWLIVDFYDCHHY